MLHVPLHRVWTPIQMIHYSTIEWKHNLLSIMQSQMQIMSITDLGAHRAHGSILGAAAAGEAPVPDPLPPIDIDKMSPSMLLTAPQHYRLPAEYLSQACSERLLTLAH
jgi:hypothetical protein